MTWPGPTKLQVLHQDMAEGRFSHVPAFDDKLLIPHRVCVVMLTLLFRN